MRSLSVQRVAEHLLRLVEFIMPDERKGWARAMKIEAAYVGQAATLSFAAGCVWAACRECAAAEIKRIVATLPGGLAMGAVFFAHAAIDGSRAWPFVWPLLGGALIVLLSASNGSRVETRSGASLGLRTGSIAGLLFAVAGIVLISASDSVTLSSRFEVLALGTLGGAVLATAGGSVAALLMRLR